MRNLVYLLVTAVLAAGVYLFVSKKNPQEPASPTAEVAPVASPEQAASAPAPTGDAAAPVANAETAVAGLGKLSDFTLTNQAGQEFHNAAMKGKVLLVNFFFTKCETTCPIMMNKMTALQEKFANDADVRFVSITVDPANDTVEALKAYSEKYKANAEKWSFLTGSKDVINDILEKQMKLAPTTDHPTHSTRIALVDKDGNIKAYYDSTSDEDLNKLETEARQLVTAI